MVTNIRAMSVGGYRHKYKDFCENFTFPKFINKGGMTITRVPMRAKLKFSLLFSSLPLVVASVQEEIQSSGCVNTARGQTLERVGELLQMILVSINFIVY